MKKLVFLLVTSFSLFSCISNEQSPVDKETYMLLANYAEIFNSMNNQDGKHLYDYEVTDSLVLLNETHQQGGQKGFDVKYNFGQQCLEIETDFNSGKNGVTITLKNFEVLQSLPDKEIFVRILSLVERQFSELTRSGERGIMIIPLDGTSVVMTTFTGQKYFIDVIRH